MHTEETTVTSMYNNRIGWNLLRIQSPRRIEGSFIVVIKHTKPQVHHLNELYEVRLKSIVIQTTSVPSFTTHHPYQIDAVASEPCSSAGEVSDCAAS